MLSLFGNYQQIWLEGYLQTFLVTYNLLSEIYREYRRLTSQKG